MNSFWRFSQAPQAPRDEPAQARRVFMLALLLTLSCRSLLAWLLPMTGDEAYFHFWGVRPDWGFYDHPPMVGWWLAALSRLSWSPGLLRVPALIAPVAVAWMTRLALRPFGQTLAWRGATLVVLAPLNAWNVAITTDIPLMVFAMAAVIGWLKALREGRLVDALWAGLALGGALLSKYFALLLAFAMLGHALWRADRRAWRVVCVMALGALPAVLIQFAWNRQWCWPNLMFNLVNRHEDAVWSWTQPLLFVLSLAYVFTPVVLWQLGRALDLGRAFPAWRRGTGLASEGVRVSSEGAVSERQQTAAALAWVVALPLAVFAMLTIRKVIGLHWLASFVAPAIALFMLVDRPGRDRMALRFAAAFAAVHWVAIGAASMLPLEAFRSLKAYPGIVMTLAPQELNRALSPWRGRFVFAADGYSPAATLGFNLHEYVAVFGPGSSHARHDDILTDWRTLNGRDILIIRKEPGVNQSDEAFFDRLVRRSVEVRGVTFYLTEGYGFRYEPYRDQVLEQIRARWYQVPTWLPAGPCYFCDRYFPDRACHR